MNETQKIALAASMALLISFVGLYLFLEFYETGEFFILGEETNLEEISPDTDKRIFLIGGSSIRPIDEQYVETFLAQKGLKYDVYNLGKDGNHPSERVLLLDEIIEANPSLVLYGVPPRTIGFKLYDENKLPLCNLNSTKGSSLDFSQTVLTNTDSLPFVSGTIKAWPSVQDVVNHYSGSIDMHLPSNFKNPKHAVIEILREISYEDDIEFKNKNLQDLQKRHTGGRNIHDDKIRTHNEINELGLKGIYRACDDTVNPEISALNEIIIKLKEAGIVVILLTPPYSEIELKAYDNEQLNYFYSKIDEIAKENNLSWLNLIDDYVGLDIWKDRAHVARHSNVTIYNEDVSKFIVNELGANTKFREISITSNDLRNKDLSNGNFSFVDFSNMNLENASLKNSVLLKSNFTNSNLINTNFKNAILHNVDLSYMDLRGTVLTGADLTNGNLEGVILEGKDLTNIILRNANLEGVDLSNAILYEASLDGANLYKVDLSGKNLTNVSLRDVDLRGKDLRGTILKNAYLDHSDLSDSNLSGLNLSETSLQGVDLRGANITHVNLNGADFRWAIFDNHDLSGKNLNGTLLEGASFKSSNLQGMSLVGHNLKSSTFNHANLSDTDLSKTNLVQAKLWVTNLEGAKIIDSNLWKATLVRANLVNADLTNSSLRFANLSGADLTNAKFTNTNLNGANLTNVILGKEIKFLEGCIRHEICK